MRLIVHSFGVGLLLLSLATASDAQARPRRFLLQAASAADESTADRAASALAKEQRDSARRIRAAQIDLIEQLMQMTPEQRQDFLRENPRVQKLPVPQQRRIRQLTQRLSRLTPDEQSQLLERYRLFLDLSPEKQRFARRTYMQWLTLPPPRRRELMREVEQLREATPEERRRRMEFKDFEEKHTPKELRILEGLTSLYE